MKKPIIKINDSVKKQFNDLAKAGLLIILEGIAKSVLENQGYTVKSNYPKLKRD